MSSPIPESGFSTLPLEMVFHINSLLPLPAHWAMGLALPCVNGDNRYWSEIVKTLGIQPPQDSAKSKETVENFYRRFNTQVHRVNCSYKTEMVYGQYQENVTALKNEALRDRALTLCLQPESADLDTFLHICQLYPISEEQRARAIVDLAKLGCSDIIQKLLRKGPINEEQNGLAIVAAAKIGRLDIVQKLLLSGSISQNELRNAVIEAAKIGRLDIIQAVCNINDNANLRGLAVAHAATGGFLETVQKLIWIDIRQRLRNNPPISENHLFNAIIGATRIGRLDILQALIIKQAPIDQFHRGMAVLEAVNSCRLDILYCHQLSEHKFAFNFFFIEQIALFTSSFRVA